MAHTPSGQPFYVIANSAGSFYTPHRFPLPLRRVRVIGAHGRVQDLPTHSDGSGT